VSWPKSTTDNARKKLAAKKLRINDKQRVCSVLRMMLRALSLANPVQVIQKESATINMQGVSVTVEKIT
jgi:hypothetical protein